MILPAAGVTGISGVSGLSGVSAAAADQLRTGASLQSLDALAGTAGTGVIGLSGAVAEAAATREAGFANLLGRGIGSLEQLDATAQVKSVQAATGDLTDVHDYVIAANEAQVATQLTTTIRNKALEAFNEIMRMPL